MILSPPESPLGDSGSKRIRATPLARCQAACRYCPCPDEDSCKYKMMTEKHKIQENPQNTIQHFLRNHNFCENCPQKKTNPLQLCGSIKLQRVELWIKMETNYDDWPDWQDGGREDQQLQLQCQEGSRATGTWWWWWWWWCWWWWWWWLCWWWWQWWYSIMIYFLMIRIFGWDKISNSKFITSSFEIESFS